MFLSRNSFLFPKIHFYLILIYTYSENNIKMKFVKEDLKDISSNTSLPDQIKTYSFKDFLKDKKVNFVYEFV